MNSQDLHNLQEAYMDVYELDEAKTPLPVGKMDAKAKELKSKFLKSKPGSPEAGKLISRVSQITATRDSKVVSDSYDLYDIILSHLLDEGYAETQEQAEVIMVNMSEDWRESIVEGMKPLPVGKMIKQAARHSNPEQVTKMAKVADTHNPNKSKRKEDDNRREGGRKRDAGRPRSNELQDNW